MSLKRFYGGLLILFLLLGGCDPARKELKAIGNEYHHEMTKKTEALSGGITENRQLDVFPFYFKGADVTYTSSNQDALKVEKNALTAVRALNEDRYAVLTANLTLGGFSVQYQYLLYVLAAELKPLSKPSVVLLRGGAEVDGFYLDDYPFQNGDQLRLTPPAGGKIYYTLDGENPNVSANALSDRLINLEWGPFTLKASAKRDGYAPSPVLEVAGHVPGSAPTVKRKDTPTLLQMTCAQAAALKSDLSSNNGNVVIDLNDQAQINAIPLTARPYFQTLADSASAYPFFTNGDYYVLNYSALAVDSYTWPATDIFRNYIEPLVAPQVTEPSIDRPYLIFYFLRKADLLVNLEIPDFSSSDDLPFQSLTVRVADMRGTPSDNLTVPVFLTDCPVTDANALKLFDSKKYLELKEGNARWIATVATENEAGTIETALCETVFPFWGDFMFGIEDATLIIKYVQTGGDALRTVYSYTSANSSDNYLATYTKTSNTVGFENKIGGTNNAMGNLFTGQSFTSEIFLIAVFDSAARKYKGKSFAANAEISSSWTESAAFGSFNTPKKLAYRVGDLRGRFSLGVNRRANRPPNSSDHWRSTGKYHGRVYAGVLTDDQINTAVTQMKVAGDYPLSD